MPQSIRHDLNFDHLEKRGHKDIFMRSFKFIKSKKSGGHCFTGQVLKKKDVNLRYIQLTNMKIFKKLFLAVSMLIVV